MKVLKDIIFMLKSANVGIENLCIMCIKSFNHRKKWTSR